jgi:hypothetical protein
MDNNTKKIAIGVGIIALLLWVSKKEKVTETPTGGSGGGGGGIGGVMPMGITLITTPAATTTPNTSSTSTTPSSSSASTTSSTSTSSSTPVKVDTTAPIDPSGGRGVYMPSPTSTSTIPTSTTPTNTMGNEAVKCPNNIIYSVPSSEVNSSGGLTSWCQRNGHYAGSTNFVGFDGKIKRPSYKVDFF